MKMRHQRKRKQALFRRHRAFLWSTIKCITTISEAQLKMSAVLEEAYAKSRQSTLDEAEVERIMVDIWQPVNGIGFKLKEQE